MGRGPGVRAVGAEAIQIDFRWKGVRCRERLRLRPTEANLKYVRRLKATIEHEIALGTFEYARHFPTARRAHAGVSAGTTSLSTALQAYIDSLTGSVEPETIREYRRDAEIVAQWFPQATLQSLTRAEVRNALAKHNLSRARLTNLLKPLRGTLRQALDDGLIETNPLHGFKIRRIEPPKDQIDPFTPAEISALRKTEHGELWAFWAWTGLRSGEIIGLRWGDVDASAHRIAIRRAIRLGREKRPKTRTGERLVDLLPVPAAILGVRKRPDPDLPVFSNPRRGADWHEAKALNRAFRRACKAANVRFRYVYQLRHTFATWALSSGENPLWVARMMGHSDVAVLFRHYGKWMPHLNPEAGSKMSGAVQSKAHRGQRAA